MPRARRDLKQLCVGCKVRQGLRAAGWTLTRPTGPEYHVAASAKLKDETASYQAAEHASQESKRRAGKRGANSGEISQIE